MTGRQNGYEPRPDGRVNGVADPLTHDNVPIRTIPLQTDCKRGNGHRNTTLRGLDIARTAQPSLQFDLSTQVYGALDLGTNNCRLLVARASRRGFLVIDAFSKIIRLGEGLSQSGMLSEAAMRRTIDALRVCASKMARRGVTRSRLVATEACRAAANGEEFIARVRRETGLELEIISRETEARLAVSGCASLIDRSSDYALIFDIGGGSSELVWLDLSASQRRRRSSIQGRVKMQDCIAAWTSLRLGVVTLADRFDCRHGDDAGFEAVVRYVMDQLQSFERQHGIACRISGRNAHFLGTSGTVTTIAGVYLNLPAYTRAKVDGCWLTAANIREVSRRILQMSHAERVREPCIGADRADLVLAGCAILEAMLRLWPCERLRVADRGLREGILTTLIAEDVLKLKRARASASEARARWPSGATTI